MEKENKRDFGFRYNLTNDGGIGSDFSVAIRDELEIGDVDNICMKNLVQIVNNEIGAVRTKAFVVQL